LTVSLLDVNVLLAMVWPAHSAHGVVERWLARNKDQQWATCPFTQAAFVRVLSNPAFSPNALTPHDATAVLAKNLAQSNHRFWPNDLDFSEAVRPFIRRIVGHQQVTDAYLLGLTLHKGGKLVTLDKGILDLLPFESPHRRSIEIVGR